MYFFVNNFLVLETSFLWYIFEIQAFKILNVTYSKHIKAFCV